MRPRAGLLALIASLSLPASIARSSPDASRPAKVLYGATVDRITQLGGTRRALAQLPDRPTVRVVFDHSEPAAYYTAATRSLASVGRVMGELLDSSAERSITVPALRARARSYLHALGQHVSIWEVGNELNGNWTGPYRQVAAKTRAAFSVLSQSHASLALTLYANDFGPNHCGDGDSELTPAQFAQRYLSPALRDRLNYLLLSYYPTQCGGVQPSAAVVASHLRRLHVIFPHARLGFGEVGLPHPVTSATVSEARRIMRWAYGLNPGLSYYTGGYFWWYAAEDALRAGAPLRRDLAEAFSAEHTALGGP
jgi:hypothetical protein